MTSADHVWEEIADFWDDHMGEGNRFQLELVEPATLRLLEPQPGQVVLDVACGNGLVARRLASLGAEVVAIDVSSRLIGHAERRTVEHRDRISYGVVDAMDRDALLALGEHRFDSVVCNMAIMDIADIEPLFSTVPTLLASGGRFVFSLLHPAFNSAWVRLVARESTAPSGQLVTEYVVEVTGYADTATTLGVAARGQPKPHTYYDRPLEAILKVGFSAGLVLDGLEEPTFSESDDDGRANWANITDVPPVLVVRMRPSPAVG